MGFARRRTSQGPPTQSDLRPGDGTQFVSSLVALAVLSSLQATIVTGPRIYHAMADDGLFPPRLAQPPATARVPVETLVVQGVLFSVPLLFFSVATRAVRNCFDTLLSLTTSALCLFSTICVASVIVLRIRRPDLPRAFKTPGYPFTPLLFIAGNVWILYNLVARRRSL